MNVFTMFSVHFSLLAFCRIYLKQLGEVRVAAITTEE